MVVGFWLNQPNRILAEGWAGGSDITWRLVGNAELNGVWKHIEDRNPSWTDLARFLLKLYNADMSMEAQSWGQVVKISEELDRVWSRKESCQSLLLSKERGDILLCSQQYKSTSYLVTFYSLRTSWTVFWDLIVENIC